jgi:hypothetical protein
MHKFRIQNLKTADCGTDFFIIPEMSRFWADTILERFQILTGEVYSKNWLRCWSLRIAKTMYLNEELADMHFDNNLAYANAVDVCNLY